MGVVNVTPDSFSDGGRLGSAAVAHAFALVEAGADLVDVGGESTRPGAAPVSAGDELARVLPVVEALCASGRVAVSVDTSKPEVAAACLQAGAHVVNDVTALAHPQMARVCAEAGAGVVLMHMRGEPRTMQDAPHYDDVVEDVRASLLRSAEAAERAGVRRASIVLDPGIGFGKTLEHNLALLAHLARLCELGYPVMIGASRKSFLGKLTGLGVEAREVPSHAAAVVAVLHGASLVRVHDVAGTRAALAIADAVRRSR